MLTCAVGSASKRSLIVMFTVSGPVPCSGAKRRGKGLDVVSTAIPGGVAARNDLHQPPRRDARTKKRAAIRGQAVCFCSAIFADKVVVWKLKKPGLLDLRANLNRTPKGCGWLTIYN